MTDNFKMFDQIADLIVKALIERLAQDEQFIKALCTSPWMAEHIANEQMSPGLAEIISKEVERALENLNINSEQIDDFDSAVENLIDHGLRDFEVDADNVNGLEDFVDNRIDNISADNIDGISDVVTNAIDEKMEGLIEANQDTLVDLIKNSPDVHEAIANSLELKVK